MGRDWHDAALENQEGAIASLKKQVGELRNKAKPLEAPALPGLEFREAANIDARALAAVTTEQKREALLRQRIIFDKNTVVPRLDMLVSCVI